MKIIMQIRTLALTFAMLGLLFTSSCNKDNEDKATPNREKLLVGAWQMKSFTVDPAIDWFGTGVLVSNIYAQLDACDKDDVTIFEANGVVKYDEGGSKCDPQDPQTETGTWTFNQDKTVLSVKVDGETQSWDVSKLESSRFEVIYEWQVAGINYAFSIGFEKK